MASTVAPARRFTGEVKPQRWRNWQCGAARGDAATAAPAGIEPTIFDADLGGTEG